MRKIVWIACAVVLLSCGGKKHDVAYYEQMVDSIRRAEQVKLLQHEAGIESDPVKAFVDTMQYRVLPIRPEGGNYRKLGQFSRVPKFLNEWFGFPEGSILDCVKLPSAHHHPVFLLAELEDSVTTTLYLATLDAKYRPIDLLCIYEELEEERMESVGKSYVDYFITSKYEITLMYYYVKKNSENPQLDEVVSYIINKDGRFEEAVIKLLSGVGGSLNNY